MSVFTIPDNSEYTDDADGYAKAIWYAHQNIFQENHGYDCFLINESVSFGINAIGYKRADNRGRYLFMRGNADTGLYLMRVVNDSSYTYKRVVLDDGYQGYSTSNISYDTNLISSLSVSAFSVAGLVYMTGQVVFAETTWFSSSNGGVTNFPFTTQNVNGFFPASTYTNTSRGIFIRTTGFTNGFYFNGTPEAGASYAFCVTLPLAE